MRPPSEEAITVGGGVDVLLGNSTPPESDVIVIIEGSTPPSSDAVPEEALGVGTEVRTFQEEPTSNEEGSGSLEATVQQVLDPIPEETVTEEEEEATTGTTAAAAVVQPLEEEEPAQSNVRKERWAGQHSPAPFLQVTPTAVSTEPEASPRRFSEGDILDPKDLVRHKPSLSPLHHGPGSTPNIPRDPSPSPAPSTESESSAVHVTSSVEPPPCSVGERVCWLPATLMCVCVYIILLCVCCRLWWR